MAKKSGKRSGDSQDASGVNKSQAIRDALAKDPNASPKQLSAELSAQGIKVSPGFVSMIKTKVKLKARRQRKGRVKMAPQKSGASVINESDLIDTKQLVDRVGGIENAESLLETLKRLQ